MIAFFTAPATGSLLWCIALLIVTIALLVYTEMATRPPRLVGVDAPRPSWAPRRRPSPAS